MAKKAETMSRVIPTFIEAQEISTDACIEKGDSTREGRRVLLVKHT